MANRLKDSNSPYLLQHAQNPVDWYPWGPEALAKARSEDKPIFLSIGYSACHWCHVMERESFESVKTAEIMNKLFVNIKVDREERPDIDAIYLKSVVLMTGHGGWPTSVWLTPDLQPFYGGTYFPPVPRLGQPSFAQVLLSIAAAWRDKRADIVTSGQELIDALGRLSEVADLPPIAATEWLDKAVAVCEAQYDQEAGGFGGAPKFPQAMTLRFLLLKAASNKALLKLVDHSAQAMAQGGLYDQLGGGFHRYSVDAEWTVPHFEKMLYDNALMLGLYADLAAVTKNPLYRWVVETLVGWLAGEMKLPHGGFASSTDADSDGAEGKFFVWSPEALQVLEDDQQKLFAAFYDVTSAGNFEGGQTVLTQRRTLQDVAADLGWDLQRAASVLESARQKALEARSRRNPPGRDDKAVASWNAQTVSALCRAARQVGLEQARGLALTAGGFLKAHFSSPTQEGELGRLVIGQQVQGSAQAEDIGSLVLAFFDLYELTLEDDWLVTALPLYEILVRDYWDEAKGLTAMTSPRVLDIPLRPYAFEDNATPSAHSLLLECARRHFQLTGDANSKTIWEKAIGKVAPLAQRAPTGLGLALQSAVLVAAESQQLVVAGASRECAGFLNALTGRFLPNLTVTRAGTPGLDPELARGKTPGQAYLCGGTSCLPPASEEAALADQLSALTAH